MLHDDDDEDEEEEQEEEEPEQEKKKTRKKTNSQSNKEGGAKKDGQNKDESEEESDEESPGKKGNAVSQAFQEIDPLVHLCDIILGDKKEEGVRKYYIKYKGLSYHYCKWILEDDFTKLSL